MAKVFSKGGWGILIIPLLIILAIFVYLKLPPKKNSAGFFESNKSAEYILQFKNLPPSGENHYELWSKDLNGGEQIVGSFRVMEGGTLISMAGDPLFSITSMYVPISGSEMMVTFEKVREQTTKRSDRVILSGVLNETQSELSFPVKEISEKQEAVLANPTVGSAKGVSGVWFSKDVSNGKNPSAGLSLPKLPEGWVYGGWVTTINDKNLQTGTFKEVNNSDNKSPYSAEKAGWKVPGEDFLKNAPKGLSFPLNLADGKTKVTIDIEPYVEQESMISEPFIPIISQRIPYKQNFGKSFVLERVPKETFPSGKISIEPQDNN